MLTRGLRMRGKNIPGYSGAMLLGFAIGQLMLLMITSLNKTDSGYKVVEMGTMIAALLFCFAFIFADVMDFKEKYNILVGFGMTRRVFYIQEIITSFVIAAVFGCAAVLLYELERKLVYLPVYRQVPHGTALSAFEIGILFLLWVILVPTIRFFFGCIVIKFGKVIGFWGIWALWMIICQTPGKIGNLMENGPQGILQTAVYRVTVVLVNISLTGRILAAAAGLVLLYVVSWLLIRRQAVA